MTNQGTPFSFHCMICFEEFQADDRYPVVLPCGHTYVCNCCANRLDRCMECRTPLYELVPQQQTTKRQPTMGHNNSPSWSSARSTRGNTQQQHHENAPPPQPPMKRRLALPKNVVLLSLIEAMELASAGAARTKYTESPTIRSSDDSGDASATAATAAMVASGPSIPDLQSRGSMLDVEDEEEEKIKISTSLAVGFSGTYAVAARDGLRILQSRPICEDGMEAVRQDEDVDSLVRVYHLDQANSSREDDVKASPDKIRNKKDPLKLCYGDRVQVVSVDGGWAKLARGYGFVQAGNNQLVKVGGTLDRACKLEAMLCSLSNRRKSLRVEQSKIDNEFFRFMNELQHSLQQDEDLTVILSETFSLPTDNNNAKIDFSSVEKEEKSNAPEERNDYPQKPPRASTPSVELSRAGRFSCFAGGVFEDDTGSREQATATIRSGWDVPEFSLLRLGGSNDSDSDSLRAFPGTTQPSPSAMRAGAQAWREQHGRTASTDSSINFRTGMSGHMALLSTHAHPHEYLEPNWMPRQVPSRMMSAHTGLTMPKMPTFQGILNSLTLPSSTTSNTPPRHQSNSPIHHTGSM